MAKLPKDHVVCGLCQEIIHKDNSKQFVSSIEWGSFDGRPNYGVCCKSHKTSSSGYPLGKYARSYA